MKKGRFPIVKYNNNKEKLRNRNSITSEVEVEVHSWSNSKPPIQEQKPSLLHNVFRFLLFLLIWGYFIRIWI